MNIWAASSSFSSLGNSHLYTFQICVYSELIQDMTTMLDSGFEELISSSRFHRFCNVQLVLHAWSLIESPFVLSLTRKLASGKANVNKVVDKAFIASEEFMENVVSSCHGPLLAFDVLDASQFAYTIENLRFCALIGNCSRIWIGEDSKLPPEIPADLDVPEDAAVITLSRTGERIDWSKFWGSRKRDKVLDAFGFEWPIVPEHLPTSKTAFECSTQFILESSLSKTYILKTNAKAAGIYNGKERFFSREDCTRTRSKSSWALQSRTVKPNETPAYSDSRGKWTWKFFTREQTEQADATIYPRFETDVAASSSVYAVFQSSLKIDEINAKNVQHLLWAKTPTGFAVYIGHEDRFRAHIKQCEDLKETQRRSVPETELIASWKLVITRILVRRYLNEVIYKFT